MNIDEKIKVTVLMSVYNTSVKLLKESISSILKQTYACFEFIIIDDGCDNEETIKTLKEYRELDVRIKYFRNSDNIGLTKSLNIGLLLAQGQYIARMDADDIALQNRLELQADYMDKNPDIAILGCNVEKFGASNNKQSVVFRDYTQGNKERFRIKMFLYNAGPIHSSVMIRKTFLEENNIVYRENIKKAQDYALWIDCLQHGGTIYNLPETLLKYRMHSGQITIENSEEQNKYARKIIEEQLFVYGFKNKEASSIISSLCSEEPFEVAKKYIGALKKLIIWNSINKIFREDFLEEEIRIRWLNKIIKNFIVNHKIKPFFNLYSIQCLFGKPMLQWVRIYILKKYK